jgi:hypothetical protein
MISPVSHASPVQAQTQVADKTTVAHQPAPQTQAAPADTVRLSAAASLRQELTETSVQTAREASHGDIQAKNLLAKEAAEKKAGF